MFKEGFDSGRLRAPLLAVCYFLLLGLVRSYADSGAVLYRVNFLNLGLLIAVLGLLVIFERKIGFYAWIKDFAVSVASEGSRKAKKMIKDTSLYSVCDVLISAIYYISLVSFVGLITVSLMLSILTYHTVVWAFVLGFTLALSFIIKRGA